MKMSTRTRYGARALMELAINYGKGPLSLKEISTRQGIPLKYLEQIVINLRESNIITSVRGPLGGYELARKPDKINLDEIIEVLEGSLGFVQCVEDPSGCEKVESCALNELWKRVSQETHNILTSFSLADLVEIDSHKKNGASNCFN